MLLAVPCFDFIRMQYARSQLLRNNESCKSLTERYTDIRVKSSCWLFNAVGDSGTGSNLALNPMKVLPYGKGQDKKWHLLVLVTKAPDRQQKWTYSCISSNKMNPTVTPRQGWERLLAFVLCSVCSQSPPDNVGLSCRKPRFLRFFSTIFIRNCHSSCWVRVSVRHCCLIHVPQEFSQLTHFWVARVHQPQCESQSFITRANNDSTARTTTIAHRWFSISQAQAQHGLPPHYAGRLKVCLNLV